MKNRCDWVVSIGKKHGFCNAPATHYNPECGSVRDSNIYCREHAEDFEKAIGAQVLREIPIEETKE